MVLWEDCRHMNNVGECQVNLARERKGVAVENAGLCQRWVISTCISALFEEPHL